MIRQHAQKQFLSKKVLKTRCKKDEAGNMKDEAGNMKDEAGNMKDEAGNMKDEAGNMKHAKLGMVTGMRQTAANRRVFKD